MATSTRRRGPDALLLAAVITAYAGYAHCAQSTSPTTSTTTPSRGDAIAKGDKLILNANVPIFTLDPKDGGDGKTPYCAPARSKIEIESAPTTTTTTQTKST